MLTVVDYGGVVSVASVASTIGVGSNLGTYRGAAVLCWVLVHSSTCAHPHVAEPASIAVGYIPAGS